jgi:hypothetical protein
MLYITIYYYILLYITIYYYILLYITKYYYILRYITIEHIIYSLSNKLIYFYVSRQFFLTIISFKDLF